MTLQINGKAREVSESTTLLELLESKEIDPRFVVVEYNGTVLRRNFYGEVDLNEGDVLEIVHMIGGG